MKKKYTADDITIIKSKGEYHVDISRKCFENNLILATQLSLEFARTLVVNELPDKIKYLVILGGSYDGNSLEKGEQIFPNDYGTRRKCFLSSSEVTELLWRDGKVPEWINIYVDSENGEYSYIKLECCGRYSSDTRHIYHAHEGKAPFHVLGPPLPPEHDLKRAGKFDLNWNKS